MAYEIMGRRKKDFKVVEIEPGETRTVCWGCGTIVTGKSLWCKECLKTEGARCERCNKPSKSGICKDCKRVEKELEEEPPPPPHKKHLEPTDRRMVEKLWAEGLSAREITEQIGTDVSYPSSVISRARNQHNWNLPHRYPQNAEFARNIAAKGRAAIKAKKDEK